MTPGQSRVAVLLLLLLALEAVKQPPIKAALTNLVNSASGNAYAAGHQGTPGPLQVNVKHMVYWIVAAMALIALASPAPDAATMFVVILLVGVVLSDVKMFTALLTPPPIAKK